jgi:hypothetical protein
VAPLVVRSASIIRWRARRSTVLPPSLVLRLREASNRVVSPLLAESNKWSAETFGPYASERAERMRRVRFTASLWSDLFCMFGSAGARRGSFFGQMASHQDPTLNWAIAAVLAGADQFPPQAFDEAFN